MNTIPLVVIVTIVIALDIIASAPIGAQGALMAKMRFSEPVIAAPGTGRTAIVSCNPGEIATGGGYQVVVGSGNTIYIQYNQPDKLDNKVWAVSFHNTGTSNVGVSAIAQCTSLIP